MQLRSLIVAFVAVYEKWSWNHHYNRFEIYLYSQTKH